MKQSAADVLGILDAIEPFDEIEERDLATARAWVLSGAPLWRLVKPGTPSPHLVSYFVLRDPVTLRLLLVEHRLAGLWLPAGGHVEPGEHPWQTVVRECQEELAVAARPWPGLWEQPVFLTVTDTRGPSVHTDISLWYLLEAPEAQVVHYDQREFGSIRWLAPDEILAEPLATLDPAMHRFVGKLLARQW